MTNGSDKRTGFPRAKCTGATIILIVATILMSACATPQPAPVSAGEPSVTDARQRSAKSSGIAYQETPVYIAQNAPRVIGLAGTHRMGNAQARIGIVEYSDYQCPYCRGFNSQVLPQLKKEYVDSGIVQFIHKDLPLRSIHPQALPAALAAGCAGAQQRFWPMHEALYAHSGQLSTALYPKLGREIGLDESKFTACLGDASREQVIMRDVAEARGLGITGTPSFVIGSIQGDVLTVARMAKGAANFEEFAREIEKMRKSMDSGATPRTK